MSIFDRYLLSSFLKVLLISFLSMTGLFIIIDMFGNLEEFISYAERQSGLASVLIDYYTPRVFSFFDRTSALLALVASIFTITLLQRKHELTAVMAAGIPKARVVRPLIGATMVIALLGVANRELVLPRMRDSLSRNAQDWLGETAKRLAPRFDYQTGILLGGQSTLAAYQRIVHPAFRLPRALGQFGRQLSAAKATYQKATENHPSGYLLDEVKQPENINKLPSAVLNDSPVILAPHDTPWLKKNQCFVTSNVTFEHLAAGRAWRQYSSTTELIDALRNPSLDYGADTRVIVHARLVQPLLDVTLLLLGLPLILTRGSRGVFVAAAQCLLLVAVFHVAVLVCHALGNNTYMIGPSLAAWCPLFIFGPIAYTAALRRWE